MSVLKLPDTRRGWLLWLLPGLLIAGLAIVATRQLAFRAAPQVETEAPLPGFLAPDFTLQTHTGEALRLSDLRGRPVVLNFWASWCGPCRIETPHFQAFSEQYADELVVVGVNQQESTAVIADFAAEFGLTYPLLVDASGEINRTYAVFGLPTTLFIDAEGVIVDIAPGAITAAYLEERTAQLVAESP